MEVQKIIKINGMTCTSCERILSSKLSNVGGITGVDLSYSNSSATIKYIPSKVTFNQITKVIEDSGYRVHTRLDNLNLMLFIILIILIYLIVKTKVGFNFMSNLDQSVSFGILFVIGLLSSFHCVAMCGGINLSQSLGKKVNIKQESKFSIMKPSILYNSGRVISYTVIGGIVGAVGGVLSFTQKTNTLIMIFAGLFMVVMGLKMLNIIPKFKSSKMNIQFLNYMYQRLYKKRIKTKTPFIVGLFNGFMPCGPLQTIQLYALGTGSMIEGSLSMFFFSIGTVPLMFSLGTMGGYLKGSYRNRLTKLSALFVIILGLIMMNRGLTIDLSIFDRSNFESNVATTHENYQYIETTFTKSDYENIQIEKDLPVRWIIYISEEDLNDCNRLVLIPEYNIEKTLKPGRNLIEFTPTANGSFDYYCSMRMIRSKITVVDGN
ncbi:urease accessory protein UreH domain-containing protein [Haloplasma contractile]|uniref:Heavy metal-associated domain protein n=1 Tax=Haloplasma contractile SSD-17B TaxID=1033810 RepID=U2DUK7_9MOLU|nr:sulfite exporter TauE/SafE family protein [Haloplasma contractile]ERJ12087.1 Heavy metal-associated domain protein [Haloplasma contractile SSD-17B]